MLPKYRARTAVERHRSRLSVAHAIGRPTRAYDYPRVTLDPDPFGERRTPAVKRWLARNQTALSLVVVVVVAVGLIVLALVTGELPEGG